MTNEQFETLKLIRETLRLAYADYFRLGDGCTKHLDGHITIKYPPYWHKGWDSEEAYAIEIYSYSLGPSRTHTWEKGDGRSDYAHKYCADPFKQALEDVRSWHNEFMADPGMTVTR